MVALLERSAILLEKVQKEQAHAAARVRDIALGIDTYRFSHRIEAVAIFRLKPWEPVHAALSYPIILGIHLPVLFDCDQSSR